MFDGLLGKENEMRRYYKIYARLAKYADNSRMVREGWHEHQLVCEICADSSNHAKEMFKKEHQGWRKGFQYDLTTVKAE